ncbi:MAG: hypothetical protein AAFZ65_13775 [Planctomycetota bacterium]
MAAKTESKAPPVATPRPAGPDGSAIEAAERAWAQLGRGKQGRRRQLELVREVVADRTDLLVQAYASLGAVGYGDRLVGERVEHEPCLVFYVDRKLSERSRKLPAEQRLPKHVLAHATVARKRRQVAIPTDVREGAGPTVFRAHSTTPTRRRKKVRVESAAGAVLGVPTLVVRLRNASDTRLPDRYLLSCLHVLGVTEKDHPGLPEAELALPEGAPFAVSTRKAGSLIDASTGDSFDAALARVDGGPEPLEALRKAVPEQPTARARLRWQIPPRYVVWTARGTLAAERLGFLEGANALVAYKTPGGELVTSHRELVESLVDTEPGDSGSPVVSEDGTKLLGMHIAGIGRRALMIPAYDLIGRPFEFRGLSANWKIELDRTFRRNGS